MVSLRDDGFLMTGLVVLLASVSALRRRRGGEVGPDEVGEVEDELEEGAERYAVVHTVGGTTAREED